MFNNLPILTKANALDILSKPIDKLHRSSDYYKAVSNLLLYPGHETEDELINFLKKENNYQGIQIAQRKAIEVLASLNCYRAIPDISIFLKSNDPYMVENSALALQKLSCKDAEIHDFISNLLEDPKQSRRVLIKALVGMGVTRILPKLKELLEKKSLPNGVYGAAISAISKLSSEQYRINDLEHLLQASNQNDRQSAVEDIIDAGAIDLLPEVIKTPISPFFRLRAVNNLWPSDQLQIKGYRLLDLLDNLITDHPEQLRLITQNNDQSTIELLINDFFNTDFNKGYLALKTLIRFPADDLWDKLMVIIKRINKDYGAIYFLIKLFTFIGDWDNNQKRFISEFSLSLLSSDWPDYIKFRPAAIFLNLSYNCNDIFDLAPKYLDPKITPYWVCRYSALKAIELNLLSGEKSNIRDLIQLSKNDNHSFVALKANSLYSLIKD